MPLAEPTHVTSVPSPADRSTAHHPPHPDPGAGLRARIWTACLLPAVAGAAAVLWVAASAPVPDATNAANAAADTLALGPVPIAAAAACLVLGIVLAAWLDGGISGRLRRVLGAWADGDLPALRAGTGAWGEVGAVAGRAHEHAGARAESERRIAELDSLRERLRALKLALDQGDALEPVAGGGPLGALAARMDERLTLEQRTRSRESEAALAAAGALDGAFDDAQHSAEFAEKSFVESTALLTTVRELQRLGMELAASAAQRKGTDEPAREAARRSRRDALTGAFEELVRGSGDSVDHLAAGLLRVQDIVDQVQRLANRATVIALNVVVEGAAGGDAPLGQELRALAREVRSATDRTLELSRELDGEVRSAVQRMHDLRGRVAARLESLPEPEAAPAPDDNDTRLLERVREMIQDAARKTERLASTGERASRAAEHLVRRLDDRLRETDARLRELQLDEDGSETGANGGAAPAAAAPGLRVVGPQAHGDEPETPAEEEAR